VSSRVEHDGGIGDRLLAVFLVSLLVILLIGCDRESGSIDESPETVTAAAAPRIVLLVSIDTLRADHLGVYGYERFTSPVLDAIAAEGAVFLDASSTAPWTLPSHASMLTGRHPRSHGAQTASSGLDENVPTLAGLLARAGWRTAAVVNSTWLKRETFRVTRDFDQYKWVEDIGTKRTPTTWVTDQAITWLQERDERPLFLFVHYYDVHSDYASLPEYERLFVTPYEGAADGTAWQLLKANLEPSFLSYCRDHFDPGICTVGHAGNTLVVDGDLRPTRFDANDIRHLKELYDAGIRQMDEELGRLVRFLRDAGLLEQTLLLVTSDHGEEFLDHGRMDHYLTQYQEVLRVPLIVRGPGVPPGTSVSAPVSIIDIAPTVLWHVGEPVPESLEGLDLSPLWRGQRTPQYESRYLYGQASGGLTWIPVMKGLFPIFESVRQGRYKLVYEANSGRHQLFDLAEDPAERTDIASREPEITKSLQAELRRVRAAEAVGRSPVELDPGELERLRALGYAVP